MTSRLRYLLLAWLAVTAAGGVVASHLVLERLRASFEAEAQSAYQALALGMREHETLVETLALLQPGAAGDGTPEQRLGGLYPAVHKVLRRDERTAWPDGWRDTLAEGESRSQRSARAALVRLDLDGGSYWLVRSAQPASFALQIDLRQMASQVVQTTLSGHSEAWVWLEQAGTRRVVVSGATGIDDAARWRFGFRRRLALDAAAVDFVAQRRVDWLALPWTGMATWFLATTVAALALAAWWRGTAARATRRDPSAGQLGWKPEPAPARRGPAGRGSVAVATRPASAGPAAAQRPPLLVTLRELDAEPPELVVARGAIREAARQSRRTAEAIARLRRGVDSADIEGRLQRVDWDDVLHDALELIEPDCERLGVVTSLASDTAAVRVQADPVALEQIVHQLLQHALHALEAAPPDERRIELAVTALGDGCGVLSVRHTGSGPLPPDAAQRSDALPGATSRGGLLGRCALLAESMGGSLAASHAPRGALLRLTLPLAA